jgi:hypothetical protein
MLDLSSSVGKRKKMSMREIRKLGVAVTLNSVGTIICDSIVKGLCPADTS